MINENVDIGIIKQYLQADPRLLTDIYNMMKYRELRTEQVYYAHLAYEYDHVDIMKQSKIVRNGDIQQGQLLESPFYFTYEAFINSFCFLYF